MNLHQATYLLHVRHCTFSVIYFDLLSVSPKITRFSFTSAAPSTPTVSPKTTLAPQCPGNQVMLESSTACSCPSTMVKDGDNCTCPVGFTLEGAAECKGEER